jgi:hypothetical protein
MHDPDSTPHLQALDPESHDEGYWERFKHRVMTGVGPELARRRARRRATISDVVLGWRNALVPTALLAAAVAGLLLLKEPSFAEPAPLALEELLVSGMEDEAMPSVLREGLTNGGSQLSLEESF